MQAHLRYTTIERLTDLPLQVYGNGWEALRDKGTRATFHPAENFGRSMAMTNRAKIALHAIPYYYESHERVFNGMAHGAAVMASRSGYFESIFTPGRDLLVYGFADADLPDRLAALARDPAKLAELGANGRRACLAAHTWHHRAADVARLVALYGTGAGFATVGSA